MNELRLEWRTSEELADNEHNWRKHPAKQIDALKDVIGEVGWAGAALYNERTKRLIDGHARKKIANGQKIPVLIGSWTEEQEKKILATLDPLAAMAEADQEKLDALIAGVETESEAINAMLKDLATSVIPEMDNPAAPDPSGELQEKWGTATGQLWVIEGKQIHRLVCGDSTNKDDVERVLDGNEPFLMVTDPPYGVNYNPEWRNEAAEKGHLAYADRRIGKVENDDRVDWSDSYLLFPGNVAYTWSPPGDHVIQTGQAIQSAGFQIRNQIIWSKPHFPVSRGAYTYQHEPCWYAVRKGSKANWIGALNESTVWKIPLDKNVEGGHSTQKPLECMARPIRNHEGDVYEPFLGSGTTMVAAEQLERKCFAVEISPEYVAVALERMTKLGCECRLAEDLKE